MKIKSLKSTAVLLLICMLTCVFCSCAKNDEPVKDTAPAKSEASDTQKEVTVNDTESSQSSGETRYGDAEVYKKGDSSYAKTDDGQEVELSTQNMQQLLEAYEKVKGSGSDEEKDILNKIQLILEAPKN